MKYLLLLTLLAACAAPTRSPHADELALHPYDALTMESPLTAASDGTARPNRIIFGYIPYWVSASAPIHWDLLTHVAYFSLELGSDLTWSAATQARIAGTRFKSIREQAKAHGVKFVVTVTNFTSSGITTLVGNKQAEAVDAVVQMVRDTEAEGVNIDFEFVPKASAASFVGFMQTLTSRLHAEVPGSHVTFASPSSSFGGAYDYPQLLAVSDGAMIMFYGCHYSGSGSAGPLAPLTAGSEWSASCNMQQVAQYFLARGPKERIIMGLPFYGYQWPTTSSALGASTTAHGTAKVWTACKSRFASNRRWDDNSQTPWASFTDAGVPQQLWCDDGESMERKIAHLQQQDLGGLGIWALGYEGDTMDYWAPVQAHLTSEAPSGPTGPALPVAVLHAPQTAQLHERVALDGSQSFDPSQRLLSYHWEQKSGPVTQLETTGAGASFVGDIAGNYVFWLTVGAENDLSIPAEVAVFVAVSPEIETPMESGNGSGEEAPTGALDTPSPRLGVSGSPQTGCNATTTAIFYWIVAGLALRRRITKPHRLSPGMV